MELSASHQLLVRLVRSTVMYPMSRGTYRVEDLAMSWRRSRVKPRGQILVRDDNFVRS